MDYEKLYKEALERAKAMIKVAEKEEAYKSAITIFPELKENEDERIRKELIDAIQGLWDNDALPMPLSVKRKDNWLAWLEKQGEQENLCDKCRKEQPSHSCQDITALGRCAVEHEQKLKEGER